MEHGLACATKSVHSIVAAPRRILLAAAAAGAVAACAALFGRAAFGPDGAERVVLLTSVLTAGSCIAAGAYLAGRSTRPADDRTLIAVRTEMSTLREENARLRMQVHRAADVGQVVDRVRQIAAESDVYADDGVDAVWERHTEAAVMRTALLAACRDLQTALGQAERRLTTMTPGPELDRRLTDRRRPGADGAADRRAASRIPGQAEKTPVIVAITGSEPAVRSTQWPDGSAVPKRTWMAERPAEAGGHDEAEIR